MSAGRSPRATPRPFLKWAGGKRQLIDALMKQAKRAKPFEQYHEPFVGGGALFFELKRTKQLEGKCAYLSDTNGRLIETYLAVKKDAEQVIELLREHAKRHSEDYYYALRGQSPKDLFARAARIIYLNKTGYNGLFRENSKGEFNVPYGRYKNPGICDEDNLRAVSDALQDAVIEARPFDTVERVALEGDFVYFDPPYHPVSKTSSFTRYSMDDFGEDDQRALAETATELHKKGVKVLLSNSMTPLVKKLYPAPFKIGKVMATRQINSKAELRGRIAEALIRSF